MNKNDLEPHSQRILGLITETLATEDVRPLKPRPRHQPISGTYRIGGPRLSDLPPNKKPRVG